MREVRDSFWLYVVVMLLFVEEEVLVVALLEVDDDGGGCGGWLSDMVGYICCIGSLSRQLNGKR